MVRVGFGASKKACPSNANAERRHLHRNHLHLNNAIRNRRTHSMDIPSASIVVPRPATATNLHASFPPQTLNPPKPNPKATPPLTQRTNHPRATIPPALINLDPPTYHHHILAHLPTPQSTAPRTPLLSHRIKHLSSPSSPVTAATVHPLTSSIPSAKSLSTATSIALKRPWPWLTAPSSACFTLRLWTARSQGVTR